MSRCAGPLEHAAAGPSCGNACSAVSLTASASRAACACAAFLTSRPCTQATAPCRAGSERRGRGGAGRGGASSSAARARHRAQPAQEQLCVRVQAQHEARPPQMDRPGQSQLRAPAVSDALLPYRRGGGARGGQVSACFAVWLCQSKAEPPHRALTSPVRAVSSSFARRYLYKVKGPEACNFPVTPELAAELDALTVEQIQQQLKCACAGA